MPGPFTDFVAAFESYPSLTQRVQLRAQVPTTTPSSPQETFLVSSPGFGALDSGCGRTIIGEKTLLEFERLWNSAGIASPPRLQEDHHFRFGNGQAELSSVSAPMPVVLAGRRGTINAAVVKGSAPLLVSRSALQSLQASLDFAQNTVTLFQDRAVVPLTVNEAGQYVLNLLDTRSSSSPPTDQDFSEVMIADETNPSDQLHDRCSHTDSQASVEPSVSTHTTWINRG